MTTATLTPAALNTLATIKPSEVTVETLETIMAPVYAWEDETGEEATEAREAAREALADLVLDLGARAAEADELLGEWQDPSGQRFLAPWEEDVKAQGERAQAVADWISDNV